MAFVSFLVSKKSFEHLGFRRSPQWKSMAAQVFGLMVVWSIITLGVTIPVLHWLTGQNQDLSAFLNLKGNVPQLFGFLLASWTLAALGEEFVYRGYMQQKVKELFGNTFLVGVISVVFSSVLFGLAHTEQGLIGVCITFLDAVWFSVIKRHYQNNLWAAVLAHGFSNSIGIIWFFFFGPIYSFW